MPGKPTFLNIDVDVVSSAGGRALARYFREHAVVLREEADSFSFEALDQHEDADACVATLVSLIRAMPVELALLWDHSPERYFDVGYEVLVGTHAAVVELSSISLQAMSEIGVKLRVTVYRMESAIR